MRPRPVNRLHLADDPFLKIEPPLAPPENLRDGRLSLEHAKDGMPHRAVLKVNFAVAAPGLEGETPAPLAEATHLQNFGRGKLIEIADQGVTRVDSLRCLSRMRLERANKASELMSEPT